MNKKKKITGGYLAGKMFCGISIGYVTFISLVPFLWLLLASVKSNSDILSGSIFITDGIHFENYATAIKSSPILQFFGNSIFIALGGTALNLMITAMAAYVVSRFDFFGKTFLKLCFSSILVIPVVALLQPLFTTMTEVGLYDKKLGLVIVYTGLGLATSFFIINSYYNTIPKSIEEAAVIDGASFYDTFFRIILPLSKPCLATAGVMQFILCWNEFTFAMTLTSGSSARTLPIALSYFLTQFASDYGAMFAAAVMVAVPSIVVFILLQKHVIEGLTAGSTKG